MKAFAVCDAQVFAIDCSHDAKKTCQSTVAVDPQDETVTLDWEAGAEIRAGKLKHRDQRRRARTRVVGGECLRQRA